MLWALTPEGEFTDDSPSWRALTGQSQEEARGRGWMDVVHPEDRTQFDLEWCEALEYSRPYEVECRTRRPNLRYTRACMRGRPVFDPEGRVRGWLATSSEVWADESVRRSEERLRRATEAAQVAVWEYDFIAGRMTRTDNHDGLYGLPIQHVWQYDIFMNATHPDDREMSNRIVQASVAPGGPDGYAFDFRVIWPDGSIHWLAVTGHARATSVEWGSASSSRGRSPSAMEGRSGPRASLSAAPPLS